MICRYINYIATSDSFVVILSVKPVMHDDINNAHSETRLCPNITDKYIAM